MTNLNDEISASEIGNGSGQSGSAPHESQEERSFSVCELLHQLPEPFNEGSVVRYALVGND